MSYTFAEERNHNFMKIYHGGYMVVEKPEILKNRFFSQICFCSKEALKMLQYIEYKKNK